MRRWRFASDRALFRRMSLSVAVVDIVADNVEMLRSLGRALSAHGYPVCMFTSAELYLRTVEEGKASCVVIALGLSGSISGLDLGRAILASRRPIPVVFIAGGERCADEGGGLALGVYCISRGAGLQRTADLRGQELGRREFVAPTARPGTVRPSDVTRARTTIVASSRRASTPTPSRARRPLRTVSSVGLPPSQVAS